MGFFVGSPSGITETGKRFINIEDDIIEDDKVIKGLFKVLYFYFLFKG